MLMVAPMGRMNLTQHTFFKADSPHYPADLHTRGSTLFLFSSSPMVTGRVAELDPVPKAVVKAEVMLARNLKGRLLVARV